MPQFILYTTSAFRCPYCVRAKAALLEGGYSFVEHDVANPPVLAQLLARRPSLSFNGLTVPQIFFGDGTYIGGCDDLLVLIDEDRLDTMLEMYVGAQIIEAFVETVADVGVGVVEVVGDAVGGFFEGVGEVVGGVFEDC